VAGQPGRSARPGSARSTSATTAGAELPIGQTGVVYFERDLVAFSYHNDDERTEAARHPEHELWTTTGDIGHVDEDGYLFLTDRKAFMIISGGVNIYPQEIEDCLTMHPSVLDVAVIGIPDEEMGEQGVRGGAAGPRRRAQRGAATELKDFVRSRIAHYKDSRVVDFVDALPPVGRRQLVKRVPQGALYTLNPVAGDATLVRWTRTRSVGLPGHAGRAWTRDHPRAPLVLRDDPTTLFTGSGMQPLLDYLLGAEHPAGVRLGDVPAVLPGPGHGRGGRQPAHHVLRDARQLEPR
jgi:hypothetical protein